MKQKTYSYWVLNVQTNMQIPRTAVFESRLHFFATLNMWNAAQPGVWVHFATDTVGKVVDGQTVQAS